MLAKAVDALPSDDGWLFEPKWDGFRALVFRDGDEIYTQSRDLKPLDRYFPELAAPLRARLPGPLRPRRRGRHRAATGRSISKRSCCGSTRPRRASRCWPRSHRPRSWRGTCWRSGTRTCGPCRRASDERGSRPSSAGAEPPIHLTPATRDRAIAADWFERFEGAGLDGVVAKRLDAPYQPGKRAMLKIKHQRTADCVVAGFRWHKNGPGTHIGSLCSGCSTTRARSTTSGSPRRSRGTGVPSWSTSSRPCARTRLEGHPWREWADWASQATPTPPASACRARPRAGTAARTCPGSRSARSASRRSPTTTSRATGSATPRRSSAGAPTSRPRRCRYDQLEETAPFLLASIFGDDG